MAHEMAEPSAPGPEAVLEAIERQREAAAAPRTEQERVPYLGFSLGAEVYGLPVERLREVARVAHLRRVPGAPRGVAGLVNLRGEILCALDVRVLLGFAATAPEDSPFLIALRGFADPLCLVVDAITNIYAIAPEEIEPPPATWPAERAAIFVGTARVPEGLIGLLDLDRIVAL